MRLVSVVFAVGLAALLFRAQGDTGGVSAHVECGNSVASDRLLSEAAVVVAHVTDTLAT